MVFLPPYAPDLNPDDLVWNQMRNMGTSKKLLKKGESLQNRTTLDLEKIKWRHYQEMNDAHCRATLMYQQERALGATSLFGKVYFKVLGYPPTTNPSHGR